jgi:DNA-directed RNA polymerase I and III subunit RPAC2
MADTSRSYFDEAPKLQVAPGATENSATFVIANEDHTLGNAVRYVLMRDEQTKFCGYSMPHPSEPLVNLRLQTSDGTSAVDVFRASLNTLIDICDTMRERIDDAKVQSGDDVMAGAAAAAGAASAASVQKRTKKGGKE